MLGRRETGNETYIRELVLAFAALEAPHQFLVFVEQPDALPSAARNVETIILPTRSPVRRLTVSLPRLAARYGLDLLHSTYIAPLQLPCPSVVTIHDLSFKLHPEFFSLRDRLVLNVLVQQTLRRTRHIFVLSEFTRSQLTALYGCRDANISVTPAAAGAAFTPNNDSTQLARVLASYDITPPYILAAGNLEPRKNLSRLFAAFARFKTEHRAPHQLAIVGKEGYRADQIRRTAKMQGIFDDVRWTGYVPTQDLVWLYRGAELLVYPSLYEGFGLPVLEAMACGTPVVTSNIEPLAQLVGDCAIRVDPYDVGSLADGLARGSFDKAWRAAARARGIAHARQFTWRSTAQLTLDGYARAVAQ